MSKCLRYNTVINGKVDTHMLKFPSVTITFTSTRVIIGQKLVEWHNAGTKADVH